MRNAAQVGRDAVACAAEALLEFYTETEQDLPESVNRAEPNPRNVIRGLKLLVDVMFPGRYSRGLSEAGSLEMFLKNYLSSAWETLRPEVEKAIPYRWRGRAALDEGTGQIVDIEQEALRVMSEFFERFGDLRKMLLADLQAAYEGDPAALTYAEVRLAYPGLLAVTSYRLAHELYRLNVPIIPRIMTEWTHSVTGVDINPGAEVGEGFFIDHATGVVIGETAKIGSRVKLYQGVTLGAKSFPLDEHGRPIKHIQRHPTVEDNVVIYSNASILGGETVIGAGSTIGGNVFLVESVPAKSLVVSQAPQPRVKLDAHSTFEQEIEPPAPKKEL
jgi:serine O-acetyltransferase